MSGVFNIGGYSLPISATGNVSLDSFENFPGDFKNAYDAVANRLGTSDDKRIDAEIRREYNAQHMPPDKAAQNILAENTLGREGKVDTANLAKELVSMRTKNPDQADRVETNIRAKLSLSDQSQLTQDLQTLVNHAAKANDSLMELGHNASRHIGRITTVNDLGAYSSRILKDATHRPLPSGGRNSAAPTNGDVLNVRQVVVTLQDTARADPQLAQMLRKELEARMSPQDRADMNRMLAGESSFAEEVVSAGENPGDAIVGGGKGFINSNGDLVDLALQGGVLKAAVDLEQRASMQAFFGNKALAESMFKQAKNMRENAKQEVIPDIPHNNMAQQGGQNIQMMAEIGYAGWKVGGLAKNMLTKTDDLAKIGGEQLDEIAPTEPALKFRNLAPTDEIMPARIFTASDIQRTKYTGKLDYVVLESGELIIGRSGHISLSRGADVIAAGETKFFNGMVKSIDNNSGHYKPLGETASDAAEAAFNRSGFDATGRYKERKF